MQKTITVVGGLKLLVPILEKIQKAGGHVDMIHNARETGMILVLYTEKVANMSDSAEKVAKAEISKPKVSKKKVAKKVATKK